MLCEKFGVTGGLKFVYVSGKPRILIQEKVRPPPFDPACKDKVSSESKKVSRRKRRRIAKGDHLPS